MFEQLDEIPWVRRELSTRVLSLADTAQIEALVVEKQSLLKTPFAKEKIPSVTQNYLSFLEGLESRVCLGAFDASGQLTATLGLLFWSKLPYWTVCNMRTRSGLASITRSGLANCFQLMHYMCEAKGLRRFYFLSRWNANAKESGVDRIGPMQRCVPELSEYDYHLEAVVPPKEKTGYEVYDRMLGLANFAGAVYIGSATRRLDPKSVTGY